MLVESNIHSFNPIHQPWGLTTGTPYYQKKTPRQIPLVLTPEKQ